jgi:AraC family transcriptional regulator
MSRVDRPVAAWGFRHPLNLAALLRGHVSFPRHNDGGLVIAAQVCTRRPLYPALLPTALGLRADDSQFAQRLLFEDLTLWHATMKLSSLLEDVSSADRSYFQALGTVLVYELIHSNREQPAARQLRGGLAGWQQRIVTAYIEEQLPERIALSTQAQLVRLSRYHFCRAFKQSFGVSPQRYQNDRRIEYAKQLLANPDLSVTEVALQVGFGSSTSFAAAFRKVTGLSPSTYSRSL